MSHFRMVYQGTPNTPEILSYDLALTGRDGAWRGQEPDDAIGLYLSLQASPFAYDVPADPDQHLDITPGVDTQWLDLPTTLFSGRDIRRLDGLAIVYEGPRSVNALTGEPWRDPPGLLGTYGDEAFGPSRIDIVHAGGDRIALHLVGKTENGTSFDVAVEAPLKVKLTSSTGQAGEDRLRRWFDAILRWDDFTWERTVYEADGCTPQHSLAGSLRS